MQKLLIALGLIMTGSLLSVAYAEKPATATVNTELSFNSSANSTADATDFRPKKKKAKKKKGGHKCEAYR
jgi:hypothetical protein